jgi:hypothetical protein
MQQKLKRRGDEATHTTSYEENFLIVELFCMKNKAKKVKKWQVEVA